MQKMSEIVRENIDRSIKTGDFTLCLARFGMTNLYRNDVKECYKMNGVKI